MSVNIDFYGKGRMLCRITERMLDIRKRQTLIINLLNEVLEAEFQGKMKVEIHVKNGCHRVYHKKKQEKKRKLLNSIIRNSRRTD